MTRTDIGYFMALTKPRSNVYLEISLIFYFMEMTKIKSRSNILLLNLNFEDSSSNKLKV